MTLLYDDCLEKGKSVVDGGARYLGGIIETFGMVNVADSLAAIKQLVYDEGRLTPDELLGDAGRGLRGLRDGTPPIARCARSMAMMMTCVDDIMCEVSRHAAEAARQQADKIGLDYYLIVNINNYANVALGQMVAASADGRKSGAPLANGNTPTAGQDRKGVTAFLNSIVKPDPSLHAGYVHNMKFSKKMFADERPKLEALLKGYFDQGGTQAMITVLGRDDLEAAMREPEKHRNLMVRVGGFSARFVELAPEVQLDLLNRTLY